MRRSPIRRTKKGASRSGHVPKPLPPPAAKRKPVREDRALSDARYVLVERSRGFCEANTPDCPDGPHRGQHAHHVVLRSQVSGHDPELMLWCCFDGHRFIHDFPKESYAAGWLAHPNRITEPGIGGSYMKKGVADGTD